MKNSEFVRRVKSFRRRLEAKPTNGELWLQFASFLHDEGERGSRVLLAYRKAQKHLPRVDLGLLIGTFEAENGNGNVGLRLIKQSLRRRPTPYGFCMLANAYLTLGQNRRAISACEKALAFDKSYDEAHYIKACALERSNPLEAITACRRAVASDPRSERSWYLLGSLLVRLDAKSREGRAALRRSGNLNREYGYPWARLGNAHWKAGELRQAEQMYKRAIRCERTYGLFHRWYGQFLRATNREAQALRQFALAEKYDA